jgi:hypothetical protein
VSAAARDRRSGLVPHLGRCGSVKLLGLLVDGDVFEAANVSRMYFASHGNKAAVVREELLPFFSESRLSLVAIEEYVTPENVDRLIHERDVVILAVDNHATRKLVGDFCANRLQEVCLISGGNDGVGKDASGVDRRGTYGNCQVHLRQGGVDLTPPLARFHPEIADPKDEPPTEQDCLAQAASASQILFANHMAASCILNTLFLYLCGALHYAELSFDIAEGLMRPAPLPVKLPSAGSRR